MMTTPQVAKRLGVSVREIVTWTERGYIEATVPPKGHGSKRLWSEKDFRTLRLIPGLRAVLSCRGIKKFLS